MMLKKAPDYRIIIRGMWLLPFLAACGLGRAADKPAEPAQPAVIASDQMQSVLLGGPRKPVKTTASRGEASQDGESLNEAEPLEPIESTESSGASSVAGESGRTDTPIVPIERNPPVGSEAKSDSGYGVVTPGAGSTRRNLAAKRPLVSDSSGDVASRKEAPEEVETEDIKNLIPEIHADPLVVDGVQLEKSTADDLRRAWGEPSATHTEEDGSTVLIFNHKRLGVLSAVIAESRVQSLLIQFDAPLKPKIAAERLGLAGTRGVDVSDPVGRPLGRVFPEHGVLMSYASVGARSLVQRVAVDPIDAEAFVARAESNLHGPYLANLADLEFAVKENPEHARAHWLTARIFLATGRFESALPAAERAANLDPENKLYQVTLAQCLETNGGHRRAKEIVEKVVAEDNLEPVIRAAALAELGELIAAEEGDDTTEAMKLHTRAIKLADPLAVAKETQVRRLAKEVLLNVHLAIARDIAWGNWKKKEEVIPKWLERASAFAEESIDNESGSLELRLRVAERALMAYSRMKPATDPSGWVQEAQETADRLLQENDDPLFVGRVHWRLGMANYHALTLARARGKADESLKYAQAAIDHLDGGARLRQVTVEDSHVIGRVLYQTGAVHAVLLGNHRQAVQWYDRAVPRLSRGLRSSLLADMRGHGDTLVSMGVSFWETGERKRALELTTAGSKVLQHAIDRGMASKDALAVAYGNLSVMHEKLGDTRTAQRYAEQASGGVKRR